MIRVAAMVLLTGWLWSTIRRDLAARGTPARVTPAAARMLIIAGVGANVLNLGYEAVRDPLALPRLQIELSPAIQSAGLLLAAAGLVWSSWARAVLGPAWSRGTALVGGLCATGPYRTTRHPIYAGGVAFYLGLIGAQADIVGVAVFGAHVAGYAVKTTMEDRLLMRDGEYRRYAHGARWRFIPYLW